MIQMSSESEFSEEDVIGWAKCGQEWAVESLIQKYRGLICMLARRLCCDWVPMEDLHQAGNLGLMSAIRHYDLSRETKLVTYAVPWILGEMRRTMKRTEYAAYSLDKPIEDGEQTMHDILAGEEGVDIRHVDLHWAISRLGRDERILLLLRYYQDKSQKESAAALGKSQAQISRMERHVLDTLYTMLR